MNYDNLRVAGEIAAAAGVIAFLVIVFCRDILTSRLTKIVSSAQAGQIIHLMVVGAIAIAVLGSVSVQYSNKRLECPSATQGQRDTATVATGCGTPK
jgi:hypothetical protein